MNYSFRLEVPEAVKEHLWQYSQAIQQAMEVPKFYDWIEPENYAVLLEVFSYRNFPDVDPDRQPLGKRLHSKERRLIKAGNAMIEHSGTFPLEFSAITARGS